MNDRFFIDTNVFVYTFDKADNTKNTIARSLIHKALSSGEGIISYQVVQEFLNVATRKFNKPLELTDAKEYLQKVLTPLCHIYSTHELFEQALEISARWQYGFYDSLIIAAAISSGCSILYTEDLQHGQKIQSIKIENPFN